MMIAGMDIVRCNFSHGREADHLKRVRTVRELNRRYRRHIRIMGDLEGPRIRMGRLPGGKPLNLEKNRTFIIARTGTEGKDRYPFDYEGSLSDIEGAPFIYLDDGNIVLEVKSVSRDTVRTRVVVGGLLHERKALNIPGAKLKFPALTVKDRKDIEFALEHGFDYLAQSFVRRKKDVLDVRKTIRDVNPDCRVIAKIECREGIRNIDGIIEAADGIMVARGDMGVSIPIYEVPLVQKDIIRRCNRRDMMVITATQMLESMTVNPRPTRAEVTDVANAVIDGTDAVMLSAETAVGKYPVGSVEMMNLIIRHTELGRGPQAKNAE